MSNLNPPAYITTSWDDGHPHPTYGCLVDRSRHDGHIGRTATGLVFEELRRHEIDEVRARVHDTNVGSLRMLVAAGFEELERSGGRVLLAGRPGSRQ